MRAEERAQRTEGKHHFLTLGCADSMPWYLVPVAYLGLFFTSEKWESERLSTLLKGIQPGLKPMSFSLFLPVSYERQGPLLGVKVAL